jgi:hypothetical protein
VLELPWLLAPVQGLLWVRVQGQALPWVRVQGQAPALLLQPA